MMIVTSNVQMKLLEMHPSLHEHLLRLLLIDL